MQQGVCINYMVSRKHFHKRAGNICYVTYFQQYALVTISKNFFKIEITGVTIRQALQINTNGQKVLKSD